eukprot:XP_003731324.1 PREDICTED: uncharacterized protein LOC100892115 [Strongylocentrotus purpuratus]
MSMSHIFFLTVICMCLGGIPCSMSRPIQGTSMADELNGTIVSITTFVYVTSTGNFEPTIHTENKTNPFVDRAPDDVIGSDHVFRRLLADILKLTRRKNDGSLLIASSYTNQSQARATATSTTTSATMRNASDDQRSTTGSHDRDGWAWFTLRGKTNIGLSSVRSLLAKLHATPTPTNTTFLVI